MGKSRPRPDAGDSVIMRRESTEQTEINGINGIKNIEFSVCSVYFRLFRTLSSASAVALFGVRQRNSTKRIAKTRSTRAGMNAANESRPPKKAQAYTVKKIVFEITPSQAKSRKRFRSNAINAYPIPQVVTLEANERASNRADASLIPNLASRKSGFRMSIAAAPRFQAAAAENRIRS